jgi:hypothetical protein
VPRRIGSLDREMVERVTQFVNLGWAVLLGGRFKW